jgi:hypothetical protein
VGACHGLLQCCGENGWPKRAKAALFRVRPFAKTG